MLVSRLLSSCLLVVQRSVEITTSYHVLKGNAPAFIVNSTQVEQSVHVVKWRLALVKVSHVTCVDLVTLAAYLVSYVISTTFLQSDNRITLFRTVMYAFQVV